MSRVDVGRVSTRGRLPDFHCKGVAKYETDFSIAIPAAVQRRNYRPSIFRPSGPCSRNPVRLFAVPDTGVQVQAYGAITITGRGNCMG